MHYNKMSMLSELITDIDSFLSTLSLTPIISTIIGNANKSKFNTKGMGQ